MALLVTKEVAQPLQGVIEKATESEGCHGARNLFLSELPGLAFAIVTLVWIASSFYGLVW